MDRKYFIHPKKLELLPDDENLLGVGAYGFVLRGKLLGYGPNGKRKMVAVKMPQSGRMTEADILAEADLMNSLQHKNVIAFYGMTCKNGEFCILMEFMKHGSLLEYLKPKKNRLALKTNTLLKIARDVALGMAYLVAQGIVHRDLAPRNVLVNEFGVAKVSDFGLAASFKDKVYYDEEKTMVAPIETFSGQFTSESDVWMFGVLMWEIFNGCSRDFEINEWMEKWRDGYQHCLILKKTENCPDWIYDLMKICWAVIPQDRPTFDNLIEKLEAGIKKKSKR